MSGVLSKNVLVLNKAWQPIDVVSVMKAICRVFQGKALIVCPKTYMTYEFEGWVDTWNDSLHELESDKVIRTPMLGILMPQVVVFHTENSVTIDKKAPKFSRKNIFARDGWICQYCGGNFKHGKMNIDHVMPKSRGGKTTWKNTVSSCIPCNDKKGSKTLAESRMVLLKRPDVPTSEDVRRNYMNRFNHLDFDSSVGKFFGQRK